MLAPEIFRFECNERRCWLAPPVGDLGEGSLDVEILADSISLVIDTDKFLAIIFQNVFKIFPMLESDMTCPNSSH